MDTNIEVLKAEVKRLLGLLEEPEVGLFTWYEAVRTVYNRIQTCFADRAGTVVLLTEPVDLDHGSLFTIQEFSGMVDDGMLIDYDGFGEWATATQLSGIYTCPSAFRRGSRPPKTDPPLTHVMWYNR